MEVTWEDQQNINRFSRLHATLSDVEEELHAKRAEKEELGDLSMELELMEDEPVLYRIGEAYMTLSQSDALAQLERDTERVSAEVAALEKASEECEEGMNKLKVTLYAKFGKNIHLER